MLAPIEGKAQLTTIISQKNTKLSLSAKCYLVNNIIAQGADGMIALLREVDFYQTKCNARKILKNYRKWVRIAGKSMIDIKSPVMSDMPKGDRWGNKAEDGMIQFMEAEAERDAILAALMSLGITSRQVLYYRYCAPDGYSNHKIGREIGYSERSVERLMSEALIEFAEAYKKGRLIAYR